MRTRLVLFAAFLLAMNIACGSQPVQPPPDPRPPIPAPDPVPTPDPADVEHATTVVDWPQTKAVHAGMSMDEVQAAMGTPAFFSRVDVRDHAKMRVAYMKDVGDTSFFFYVHFRSGKAERVEGPK